MILATNAKKTTKSKAKAAKDPVQTPGNAVAQDSYAAAETLTVDTAPEEITIPADAPGSDDVAKPDLAVEPEQTPDNVAAEGTAETMGEVADTASETDVPLPPPGPDPMPHPMPQPAPPKSGFGGMVFGGVIAAALGFGAAQYANDGWPFGAGATADPAIAQNSAQLSALTLRVDEVAAEAGNAIQSEDLDSLRSELGPVRAGVEDLGARISVITETVSALTTRVEELEKQPLQQGASEAAIAAYERELEKLQAAMAAQRAEVEAMTSSAQELEASAEEIARQTMARAAITRVLTTLDVGGSFADPLAELQSAGIDVPGDLSAASSGVATRDALRESFPDAARAALRAYRDANAGSGQTGGGLGAFLRDQLGARSVTPREGDDPDAILSRAEAAVRQGRLEDALAEIDTLPDVAKAELSSWTAQANERRSAVNAAEALAQSLSQQ